MSLISMCLVGNIGKVNVVNRTVEEIVCRGNRTVQEKTESENMWMKGSKCEAVGIDFQYIPRYGAHMELTLR